jgi:hypothetical protein
MLEASRWANFVFYGRLFRFSRRCRGGIRPGCGKEPY